MHRTTPENVQNGSSPLLAKNAMTESKTPKFAGQVLRRHLDVHRLLCVQASGTKGKLFLSPLSIFVFDDVETALLVGHPQQTSVILEHVVGQRRRYPIPVSIRRRYIDVEAQISPENGCLIAKCS